MRCNHSATAPAFLVTWNTLDSHSLSKSAKKKLSCFNLIRRHKGRELVSWHTFLDTAETALLGFFNLLNISPTDHEKERHRSQVRGFRVFGVTLITSMLSLVSAAQTGDPIAAIQQRLNSQINVTRITADRSDIVTPGDVVVIHRPGLVMYAVFSPMPPSNSYKNGKIGQGWGGFGKDLAIGMATPGAGTAADYPHRMFVPEEKCWVTGIQVQKDGVLFQLYSDPYGDTRFYANLKVPFPDKKVVPPVDVALQTVADVLTVLPADNQSGQGYQQAPPPPPAYAPPAPPAPSQYGDIAPPPPPTSMPTISIGQTKADVTSAFGEPVRKAILGPKEIYFFKDMKVTFINGKVSKVE